MERIDRCLGCGRVAHVWHATGLCDGCQREAVRAGELPPDDQDEDDAVAPDPREM